MSRSPGWPFSGLDQESMLSRGIAQWIKHLPAIEAAGVWTQTQLKILVRLSSWVPPPCALSLSHYTCCHVLQHEYLSRGRKKERNYGKILAASSVRQNTVIRAMYGIKGAKKIFKNKFETRVMDWIWLSINGFWACSGQQLLHLLPDRTGSGLRRINRI